MLALTNTLLGKKELAQFQQGPLKLYVCGITPYDYAHIGHGRCYITFDILYRVLMAMGHDVTYCRNFTDIDDKLLNRAQNECNNIECYTDFAEKFIKAFHEDIDSLQCKRPNFEPRVTHHIPQIIDFIQGLIDNGHAYEATGDVYFDINSYPDYGKLSKRNLDDMVAGSRVAVREEKRNPLDFALWKKSFDAVGWESPWSYGRPGWHIECSVLAKTYLGETIDIHGGGMDLIFPHHENELAQSEALHGCVFAKCWVHNAFVRINQEKMSKSLGNFFTLRDVFAKYDPMVLRYMVVSHHYRSPLDFSWEDLDVAEKSYRRLVRIFEECRQRDDTIPLLAEFAGLPIAQKILDFLYDDLNTPGALGVVFEHAHELHSNERERDAVQKILIGLFGLALRPLPEKTIEITPEIQKLIDQRIAARAAKDWARSDALRDELKALGYEVKDTKAK